MAGLFLTLLFLARGVRAALLLGILGTTILAIFVNTLHGGGVWTLPGVAVVPTSIVAWPDFSTLGAGLNVEVFARWASSPPASRSSRSCSRISSTRWAR